MSVFIDYWFLIYVCDAVCIRWGVNLCAIISSVWLVQKQSHDLHYQPKHSQKEVSFHSNRGNSRITQGTGHFIFV